MNLKKQLGKRIAELRKQQNYTQEKFSEKLGISITALSNIELGNNFPQSKTIENILTVLNINAEDLFRFKNISDDPEILYEQLQSKISVIKNDAEKMKTILDLLNIMI